jgi:XTP/dITP diphosphohydrolase
MRQVHQLVFASNSVDKFREFESLLKALPGVELIPAESVIRNAEKIGAAETHSTYLENASAKARLANQGCHYPCFADDTGLEVEALDGKPGIHTARFASLPSLERSRSKQDEANRAKLLAELKGKNNRNARFVTSVVLLVEGLLIHGTGILEGTIAEEPRGDQGFGYDSVFIPKGSDRTLAQMTEAEKNNLSHRSRAFQDLLVQLQARGIVLAKP